MPGSIDLNKPILLDPSDQTADAITVKVRKDTTPGREDCVQFYISKALYDDNHVEQKIRLSCDIRFDEAAINPEIENIARRVALAAIPTFKAAFDCAKRNGGENLSPENVIVKYQEDQGASSFTHRITQVCLKKSETDLEELVLGGSTQIVKENIKGIPDVKALAARIDDISLIRLINNISLQNALVTIDTAMTDVIVKAIDELRPAQMHPASPTQSKKSLFKLPSFSTIRSRLSGLPTLHFPKLSGITNILASCLPSKKVKKEDAHISFARLGSDSSSTSSPRPEAETLNLSSLLGLSPLLEETEANVGEHEPESNRLSSVEHSPEDQGSSGSLSERRDLPQVIPPRQPAYLDEDMDSEVSFREVLADPTHTQTPPESLLQDSPTPQKMVNVFSRLIGFFNKKKSDQVEPAEPRPSIETQIGEDSHSESTESTPARVGNTDTRPPFTMTMVARPETPRGDLETQTPGRASRSEGWDNNFGPVPELPRPSVLEDLRGRIPGFHEPKFLQMGDLRPASNLSETSDSQNDSDSKSDAELKNLITPVLTKSSSSQPEAKTSLAPTRGNPPPVPSREHLEEDGLQSEMQVRDAEASQSEALRELGTILGEGKRRGSIGSVEWDLTHDDESDDES